MEDGVLGKMNAGAHQTPQESSVTFQFRLPASLHPADSPVATEFRTAHLTQSTLCPCPTSKVNAKHTRGFTVSVLFYKLMQC